ncbi:MAG: trigger factor [Spirochaetes bacterium]|nr:trigger factor [Spirochaetota bacterium]
MIVSEKKLENARIELEIEVPESQVEEEYRKVFNRIQRSAKVDGFRKGKVPLDIIKKKFKGNADSEVVENVLKASYIDALNEKDLNPVSQPDFDFDTIEASKSFKYKVAFDVSPTVELGQYRNLAAKEIAYKITDDDVDKEIESLRERYATVAKKEKGEKAEKGNYVRAETRRIDNVDDNEKDNIKPQSISVVIGKNKTDYSFDDDIIGMAVDDVKEVIKKYPKDYEVKDLANQKAKYQIRIIEISNLTLPPLDDEFAKDLGDYSSIEDVRKKFRENFENFAKEKSLKKTKEELIDEIVKNSTFDLPESMILREMENITYKFQQSMGIPEDKINELFDKGMLNREEFTGKIREDAIRNIKSTLVLLEIAKAENIKPSEEKYKELVNTYAEKNNKTAEEIEKVFEESGTKQNIETDLVINGASDFVYDNATLKKQKPVSLEELAKL